MDQSWQTDQERIAEELRQITAAIERLTGLPSRWNGSVELVANATFRGKKPFSCSILINAALLKDDARWRTLIHEALHAVSAGYIQRDFETYRGWEEGVVEQLQRLLRTAILERLDVTVDAAVFERIEAEHAFNVYIEALENARLAMEREIQPFYLTLLKTPIQSRYSSLMEAAFQLDPVKRGETMRVLAATHQILTRRSG